MHRRTRDTLIALGLAAVVICAAWLLVEGRTSETASELLQDGESSADPQQTDASTGAVASSERATRSAASGGAESGVDDLRVLCLDWQRAPLRDIAVEVRALHPPGLQPMVAWLSATSGADGTICWKGARRILEGRPAPIGWGLWTKSCFPPPDPFRLDISKAFDRVVEWRLPASATLEVHVLGIDGSAVGDGTRVELRVARDLRRGMTGSSNQRTEAMIVEPTVDGAARFAAVRIGIALDVQVAAADGGWRVVRRHEGLREAGALERFDVRIGAEEQWLRARLLLAGGTPLRDHSIHCTLAFGGRRSSQSQSQSTNADSELYIPIQASLSRSGGRLLAHATDLAASSVAEFPPFEGRTLHDCGDVMLTPDVERFSGIVTSSTGEPIPGASVEVRPLPAADGTAMHPLRLDTNSWLSCDAAGHFRYLDAALPDERPRYRITASYAAARSPVVSVEAPAYDLVLRVDLPGQLEARVLLLPEVPSTAIVAELRDVTGFAQKLRTKPETGGALLSSASLAPGPYALELGLAHALPWKLRLEDLVVPNAGMCDDARLRSIDLRTALQAIEIEIDRVGRDVKSPHGNLRIDALDQPGTHFGSVWFTNEKTLRFVLPAGAYGGVLSVEGYRAARLERLLPRQRIALRSALRVMLEVDAGETPHPLSAGVPQLCREGEEVGVLVQRSIRIRVSNGTSRRSEHILHVDEAGSYRVRWTDPDAQAEPGAWNDRVGTPDRIEVRETAEEQRFVVRPPAMAPSGR